LPLQQREFDESMPQGVGGLPHIFSNAAVEAI
jgi:hypothetical protein